MQALVTVWQSMMSSSNLNSSGSRNGDITYRPGTAEDAGAISGLVLRLQRRFTFHEYTQAGRALMESQLERSAVANTITAGNVVFVAERNGLLIGVVSIRNNAHLSLNFVDEAHHRIGVAGSLWELGKTECIKRGNPGRFTLRSSTFAIPVYEKWGFVRNGPIDRNGGTYSHPMVLEIKARSNQAAVLEC
jgi:GNAT superfamily N-acetyltransferase